MTSDENLFEADLQEMELEELMASTDRFTLVILNSIYTPEQIAKFDEQGVARGLAFETCHRYMMAMKVMAERYTELQTVRLALDNLL